MKHGNTRYDFSPLEKIGGQITIKPANITSLKNRLKQLGYDKKNLKIEETGGGHFFVERIA